MEVQEKDNSWWGHWVQGALVLVLLVFLSSGFSDAAALKKPEKVIKRIRGESIFALEKALKNNNPFIRSAAIRAAGESRNLALIPLLRQGSEDTDPMTRLFALQSLEKVSPSETLALAVKTLVKDSDKWVRGAALEALGKFGGKEFRPMVRPFLKDPEKSVRLAAATSLYHLGERRHVLLILAMLKNEDAGLRYQAIGYLGKIGTQEVLQRLKNLLEDGNGRIIIYSLKAIGERASMDFFKQLKRLTSHEDPLVRRQAFQTLRHLPAKAKAEIPENACRDVDPLVRIASAVALNRSGICGEVFATSLKHEDFGVRSAAARVLGEFPHENRLNLLEQALEDPNSRVRTAAVRAVGMMGGADAFPLLMKMLNDPLEVIRAYAAGNLIRLME
ncbi:MAG: HEAT repeat domain-containing protein [Nitrospinota bacterium]|nr:HEAT repeat domain-containing protein [Nitrospinota bacterium]